MTRLRIEAPPSLNDPGTWSPSRMRLIWVFAFLVVAALGWILWLEDEHARWSAERSREAALRGEHTAAVVRIKALQDLQQRKAQLEEEVGRLERQLPAAIEMDGLLRGITAAGRVRGLQFELFRPAPAQLREGYAEIPVALRVVGGYHDIGAFLGDLARMPRIATLHNIGLTPQSQMLGGDRTVATASRLLAMEATLRTYRALDAKELEPSRRRADRAAAASAPTQAPPTGAAGTGATAPIAAGGPR